MKFWNHTSPLETVSYFFCSFNTFTITFQFLIALLLLLCLTDWCQDNGIYEFTMGATGDKVKGRYTFVYVYEDGEWKISHHHSSVMPEAFLGPSPKPAVAKKEEAKEEEKELVMA